VREHRAVRDVDEPRPELAKLLL
jgi:ketosteroid isomerase-like protein